MSIVVKILVITAVAAAEAPYTECAEKIPTSIPAPFNTSHSHLAIVQEVTRW